MRHLWHLDQQVIAQNPFLIALDDLAQGLNEQVHMQANMINQGVLLVPAGPLGQVANNNNDDQVAPNANQLGAQQNPMPPPPQNGAQVQEAPGANGGVVGV